MCTYDFIKVPEAFWDGWYRPDVRPGLPISLEQRIGSAAMRICGCVPVSIAQEDIENIVRESFYDALEPNKDGYDPVKPAALKIMAQALEYDMPVFIWTIGDTGVDPTDDDKLDPSGSCQMLKIEKGGIFERLIEGIQADKVHEGKPRDLHIDTCAQSKKSSLHTIFTEAREQCIKVVYVADDLAENGAIVQELQADFPDLEIHFYHIKDDWDTEGNMDAYSRYILPKLQANGANGVSTALVLDLDNTIISTTAALDRAADLTRRRLSELHNK